jgi:hypothetical protein
MKENFNQPENREQILEENKSLKMQLMLENGSNIQFGSCAVPELENAFLKYILEFERQSANPVYTTVFKKIDSPTHFKSVNEIADDQIEEAYDALMEWMGERGIGLGACSPNIKTRELYRFVTEELFEQRVTDMNIPGMMTSFIYDDFHPDHLYDNAELAKHDCLRVILCKQPLDFNPHIEEAKIHLNEHEQLSEDEFKSIINRFKDLFDDIFLRKLEVNSSVIEDSISTVRGVYGIDLINDAELIAIDNEWMVQLRQHPESGFWFVFNIQLGGLAI